MHLLARVKVMASVALRVSQGDSPTEPPQPREVLEEVIADIFHERTARLRSAILADPDDEPSAGGGRDE